MDAKQILSKIPTILGVVLIAFCLGYLIYLPIYNPDLLSSNLITILLGISFLIFIILIGADRVPAFIRDIVRSRYGGEGTTGQLDFDDAYEMLIEIASGVSDELAYRFRTIKHEGDGDDQIEALSETLRAGMEAKSSITVSEALEPMQTELDRRRYVENTNNSEMEVTNIDEGRLIVKRSQSEKPPAVGVPFDVYGDIPFPVDGGYETERGVVAQAKYTEQLGNDQYAMEIQDWRRNIGEDEESVKGKMANINPTVQVQNRHDNWANSDGLEDAVKLLQDAEDKQES